MKKAKTDETVKEAVTPGDSIAVAMEALSKEIPENGDVFEAIAILADDVADMRKATTRKEFRKQKKDCLRTLLSVNKAIFLATFSTIK